jgi:hypothetical protein
LKRSMFIAAVFGLAVMTGRGAQAQLVDGRWQVSPNTGRGRTDVATPPKEPAPTIFLQPGLGQSVFVRQPVAFVLIPAILMSDGTVLANFGMGFEQVSRACGGNVVVSSQMSQPTVIASNGVVLSGPTIPQTAPSQMTASQQMIRSQQQRFPILTSASQTSCFSRDQAGRFFVVRQ